MPEPRVLLPADARTRLVMAVVLAFGFAAVRDVALLPLLGLLALALALAAGGLAGLLRRLRGAALLALAFVLVLPAIAGQTVLVQAGPLALHAEGLEAGLLIGGRLLAIVAVTLALLGPVPPLQLAAALRGLGVPGLMADLALLTLRYLDELRAELSRARLARTLRGGRGGWRDLPDTGLMLAAVLIRSQRRAERLWAAMRLRGHGAAIAAPPTAPAWHELAAMALALAVALAVVALDRLA